MKAKPIKILFTLLAASALYCNAATENTPVAVVPTATADTIPSPAQSPRTTSLQDSIHQTFLQKAAQKNRPGTRAANFAYLNRQEKKTTLYRIKANRLLLLFYEPDCPHCIETINTLDNHPRLRRQVREKTWTILAIYADGDRILWQREKDKLPRDWNAGFATAEIFDRELYILPEMPTIYLLDKDKTVLLKETTPQELLKLLND
ncbi:hypothetical protein [uncultured Bacteroides sp.]|uniref:TlpA family protein disulfide reductase n=1 Tax=uncultured Bacteroides sp. TaxID=162156 RepID=UPI0025ED15F5|nr:hypothetical protein [uncultured Bacteroides sp.]